MNTKLKDIFSGKVVNKSHTINTGVDEFPRYVLEYLIDNYCAEETFHEDMEKVVRQYPMILSTKNPLFMSLYSIGGDERKHGGTCSP